MTQHVDIQHLCGPDTDYPLNYCISIDKICNYYGTKKRTIEKKANEIESVCKIMIGHEGLCGEEISDALTFIEFKNGMVITKAMAKEYGII